MNLGDIVKHKPTNIKYVVIGFEDRHNTIGRTHPTDELIASVHSLPNSSLEKECPSDRYQWDHKKDQHDLYFNGTLLGTVTQYLDGSITWDQIDGGPLSRISICRVMQFMDSLYFGD